MTRTIWTSSIARSMAVPDDVSSNRLTGCGTPAMIPRDERFDRALDVVVAVPLRAASSYPRVTERRI